MTELAAPQISSLMEALPGIAAVLRSPVANAIVALSRAGAGLEEFDPAHAEELLRYGVRRNLLTQDETDKVIAEVREAVSKRPKKVVEVVEKPKKAPPPPKPAPAPVAAAPTPAPAPKAAAPAPKAPVAKAPAPKAAVAKPAPAPKPTAKPVAKAAAPAKAAPAKPAATKPAPKPAMPAPAMAAKEGKPKAEKPAAAKPAAITTKYSGRRDPFVNPVKMRQERMATTAACTTGAKCLMIDQVVLKGVVKTQQGMIAMVENTAKKQYNLREKDPVYNGFVVKITGDSIVFKENTTDNSGRPTTREVVKRVTVPVV